MNQLIFMCSLLFSLVLSGCNEGGNTESLHFAISGEYPPFEYYEQGELKGFDIELAQMVANELGKKTVFHNMEFSSILPAVLTGQVDAAISTITITAERKKNMDFSAPYYFEGMAAVFKYGSTINSIIALKDKKITCQLGTTMELWVKKQLPSADLLLVDNNNQAIEALKAGHVDVVIMDGAQAAIFSKKNQGLDYVLIAQAEDGYGIVLPKGSALTADVNQVLKTLEARGTIKKLQAKWLENNSWNN